MMGNCLSKTIGRLVDLSLTLDGKQRLTIESDADFRQKFDELKEKDVDISISRHRESRSLNANAYAWVLIDQIAQKRCMTKTEVYQNAIREIGGVSDMVCVQNKALVRFCKNWRKKGLGWQTETMNSKIPGCTIVILYYGSSSYDTAQMSQLIDSLVQDAQSIGIDTRSPNEIQKMLDEYQCVDGVV